MLWQEPLYTRLKDYRVVQTLLAIYFEEPEDLKTKLSPLQMTYCLEGDN